MKVLLTGAAGFIGMHVTEYLLKRGDTVLGVDNLNSYYEVSLKHARLARLEKYEKFKFIKVNIEDKKDFFEIFNSFSPDRVVHLAAQAGVRYSISNPDAYIESNICGTMNVLESCRTVGVEHLVYASSSSVYGGNESLPFSEHDSVDHPVSLYAASKKANELMAHTYSHLYSLPTTGLRFFTVYGPWGRPDMALFLFTKAIIKGEPIQVFNDGNMIRDFTFIDDIVESLVRVLDKSASPDHNFDPNNPNPSTSKAPYRVFNIGNSNPIQLMTYIETIENALGTKAIKEFKPMQPGDVPVTSADTSALEEWVNFKPNTSVTEGIGEFVNWYLEYYS